MLTTHADYSCQLLMFTSVLTFLLVLLSDEGLVAVMGKLSHLFGSFLGPILLLTLTRLLFLFFFLDDP